MGKYALRISGWAFVGLALLILVLPLKWVLAALAAAMIHEGCHIAAVSLCGEKIRGISLGAGGAVIETEPMSLWKEFLCILAGPAGGLAMLLLVRWFPRTALCAAIHSLYNLLPVYPLDGGRALRCVSFLFLKPGHSELFCQVVEALCKVCLLFLAFYATAVRHLGFLPVFLVTLILVKTKNGNSPCKPGVNAVQ